MSKYQVTLPFLGSIAVVVDASTESDALMLAKQKVERMSNDEIIANAQFGFYDVEKVCEYEEKH